MKLKRVSACRKIPPAVSWWGDDGSLLGAIGIAQDMLAADWISVQRVPKNAADLTLDKWLAVKEPSGQVKGFDTRMEALTVFGGEDEELLE